MLRIMLALLLVTLTVFSSCNRTQPSETKLAKTEQPPTNTVVVLFSGLMVFHPIDNTYEVGIVIPAVAPGHKFTVREKDRDHMPSGLHWRLEITNPQPQPTVLTVFNKGHERRRPDTIDGQFDFNWIVNLEELQGKSLTLKSGLLKPIIRLPANGKLYTQYKSIDLKSWKGPNSSTASDFGFLPETIALHLELGANQELVLRDEAGGDGSEVLRVPYKPDQPPVMIHINNIRHPYSSHSDFRLYYQLFEGASEAEQFDFKKNEDANRQHPYNPYLGYDPQYDKATCCMMACTAVLTRRSIPLD